MKVKYGKNKVDQFSPTGKLLFTFNSVHEAAFLLNIKSADNIYFAIKNGTRCGGFKWKYKEEILDSEEWKTHKSGKEVSSCGRFKVRNGYSYGSLRTTGYLTASQNGKTYLVHRLVLETFDENVESSKLLVDHIDGNRSNNLLSNLRWVTSKENAVGRKPRSSAKHCQSCTCRSI